MGAQFVRVEVLCGNAEDGDLAVVGASKPVSHSASRRESSLLAVSFFWQRICGGAKMER